MARNNPTVTASPLEQEISIDGGTATYTITITNNDTSDEPATTFSLGVYDSNTDDFEVSQLSSSSVYLEPGASAEVTLTVRDKAGKAIGSGINETTVNVTSVEHDPVSVTVTTTLTGSALSGWIKNAPEVTIEPSELVITEDGGQVTYTVRIRNQDLGPDAEATTFTFSTVDSNTIDFYPSQVDPSSVTLDPGSFTEVSLIVRDRIGGSTVATNATNVVVEAPDHPSVTTPAVTTRLELRRKMDISYPHYVWLVKQGMDILGVFSTPERASEWIHRHGLEGVVTIIKVETDYPYYEDYFEILYTQTIGSLFKVVVLKVSKELEKEWRRSLYWADFILTGMGCERVSPTEEESGSYSKYGIPSKLVIPLPDPETGRLPSSSSQSNESPSRQVGYADHPDLEDYFFVVMVGKLVS